MYQHLAHTPFSPLFHSVKYNFYIWAFFGMVYTLEFLPQSGLHHYLTTKFNGRMDVESCRIMPIFAKFYRILLNLLPNHTAFSSVQNKNYTTIEARVVN